MNLDIIKIASIAMGAAESMYLENRFKMLKTSKPDTAKRLLVEAQRDVDDRWKMYQYLSDRSLDTNGNGHSHPRHHHDHAIHEEEDVTKPKPKA